MALERSRLDALSRAEAFCWATGIEDTFITSPWPATGRTLDEYELTGHYEAWREDLDLMASLGIGTARYGVPWHRIQPAPNTWEWEWTDAALERLLELRIDPIVDLVHYGLPPWIDGAFLDPGFPERMAEYAARLAERFRGRIRWYTPLNEPRITAWYCGKLGWWPPFRRGWTGFAAVLLALCRGIVRTVEALRAVDPEIVCLHVDATDLYFSPDAALTEEVAFRQQVGFLALHLVSGRVDESHPLRPWLRRRGASEQELDWFQEHGVRLDLLGLNMYPQYSWKRLERSRRGLRIRMPYGAPTLVEELVQRYRVEFDAPLMISETASRGSLRRRRQWLDDSLGAVRRLRERGVPLFGYTWWPMFALVAWAYRQGSRPASAYLEQMGLWDLEPDAGGVLRRVETPLVEAYRELVAGGSSHVGLLRKPQGS